MCQGFYFKKDKVKEGKKGNVYRVHVIGKTVAYTLFNHYTFALAAGDKYLSITTINKTKQEEKRTKNFE